MKKLLMYFVKCINHFTNSKLTADSEAESLFNYMIYKSSPLHTLEVNNALQDKLQNFFLAKKKEYAALIIKIDETYSPEPEKIIHQLHDNKQTS